ncbi:MAG: hypothetical protein J3K34DRAFT_280195 [Monoraphidium minutum]|nr:MAG: hypothetical protein J3K34DRAFT_280195 [Monoraphidium minutum]
MWTRHASGPGAADGRHAGRAQFGWARSRRAVGAGGAQRGHQSGDSKEGAHPPGRQHASRRWRGRVAALAGRAAAGTKQGRACAHGCAASPQRITAGLAGAPWVAMRGGGPENQKGSNFERKLAPKLQKARPPNEAHASARRPVPAASAHAHSCAHPPEREPSPTGLGCAWLGGARSGGRIASRVRARRPGAPGRVLVPVRGGR